MTVLTQIEKIRQALSDQSGISSDFDLNPSVVLPENRILRPAAVMVLIQDGSQLVLTKRASSLRHHPGQIAFPGGKRDEDDASLWETAKREAREEIGLDTNCIEYLGTLPQHETVTGFAVSPHVAMMSKAQSFRRDPSEVEEVFVAPLAHVLDPRNYSVQRRRWRGSWRSYYTVPYGPYYIWGATARILYGLACRVETL